MFGVVKETLDETGLAEFQEKYFGQNPIYCDKSYAFYQALGDRKVGLSLVFNPFSLLGAMCDAWNRITSKSVTGNMKGEGIVQGGIIIFGKDGKPRAMYEEDTGTDLRVADIVTALKAVREQQAEDDSEEKKLSAS